MAPYRYTSPSTVGALVLPVGYFKRNQFTQYFDRLQQASDVPLIDVHLPTGTSQPQNIRTTFDPASQPNNCVKFHFSKKQVPQRYHKFFDLEPWRQQLLVVGIMHVNDVKNSKFDDIMHTLRQKYPQALHHVVFIFGVPESTKQDLQDLPANVFPILSSNWTSLESVMSTVTGEFLAQLSVFWASRRMSSFASPLDNGIGSNTNFRGHKARNSSLSEPAVLKDGDINMKNANVAVVKQEGRTKKFLGSLYLLSGNFNEALTELGAAATILRDTQDHLWLGSALESIGFCLVNLKHEKGLQNQLGIPSAAVACAQSQTLKRVKSKKWTDFGQIGSTPLSPTSSNQTTNSSSTTPSSRRNSFSSGQTTSVSQLRQPYPKSKSFSDQTPVELILDHLMTAAADELMLGTGRETVPHLLYFEMLVRYVNLLICLRIGGGWTDAALSAALNDTSIPDNTVQDTEGTPIQLLEDWIKKISSPELDELAPELQVTILSAVAVLYMKAGFKRKWAFTCSRIFILIAASSDTVNTDLKLVDEVLQTYETWPSLQASTLRTLVALGQRVKNPYVQTEAASKLLQISHSINMPDKEQMTLYHLINSYGDVLHCQFWDPEMLLKISIKSSKVTTVKSHDSSSPFIYNPFEGTITKNENTVEAGVPTTARVYLRNILAIDIQIFQLHLINSAGESVSANVKDITVPANCIRHKVEIEVIPQDGSSMLEIAGCRLQVNACSSYTFNHPLIQIPVIPERPTLVLEKLTINKGWIMLLAGEKHQFSIQLWNSSDKTPSNSMHFAFHDSSIEAFKQLSSKQDVPKSIIYEQEYYLHNKKALEMVSASRPIPPKSSAKFDFELYGKKNVTSASIFVDYGYDESTLRRLKIPLQVTVYPSVNIERATVLPMSKSCTILLILDVQNMWKATLDAEFEVLETQEKYLESLTPNQTKRFFIEVPWKLASLDNLNRPIPSFGNKQFILDKKTTRQQLNNFWIRELLLDKLVGRWKTKTSDSERFGEIDMRAILISKKMSVVLQPAKAELSMLGYCHDVSMDKPVEIKIQAYNTTSKPLAGLLRLVTGRMAQRLMIFMGECQKLVRLEPGEIQETIFTVIFIGTGPFEVTSLIDLFNESCSMSSEQNSIYQPQKAIYRVTK